MNVAQKMLRCIFSCAKLTHPESIYSQWSHASGWNLKSCVKRMLSNEHSSFFPLKQWGREHLIDTNWCTGYSGCLLALCQGLQRKFSCTLQFSPGNRLSLMNEQGDNTMRSFDSWKLNWLSNIDTFVNVTLLHFNEMLVEAKLPV